MIVGNQSEDRAVHFIEGSNGLEIWYCGVCYGNVLPEEIIDEVLRDNSLSANIKSFKEMTEQIMEIQGGTKKWED